MAEHIADAEDTFRVINITPDFCRVDGKVIPYDIEQVLTPEKARYSPDVLARGKRVLKKLSIISGVQGNAGEGIASGVSQRDGHTLMLEGDPRFLVNGDPTCRHGDACLMNVKVG